MVHHPMDRKPPFASGEIVGDYEPLFIYWRVARDRGREDLIEASTLSNDDFEYVKRYMEVRVRLSLADILDDLSTYFKDRVDEDTAREAYRRLGIVDPKGEYRVLIARILAGWLIEAAETWGILRIRNEGLV